MIVNTTTDTPEQTPTESKLDLAGYAYAAGDAALVVSGLMDKNWSKAATGGLYLAGAGLVGRYGRENPEHQLQELCHKLRKHLDSEHVPVPGDSDLAKKLVLRDGVWDNVERFLYKYPSEILNTLFAVGGAQLFITQRNSDNKWLAASGALVTAGALAGLFIPEKDQKEKTGDGFLEKGWSWVREHPLPIAGTFYMGNNFTNIMAALKDREARPENKSYMFLFVTTACYIVANILLTQSHKSQEKNAHKDDTVLHKLEDIAARVVAAQPEENRTQVMTSVAHYLSKQPQISHSENEITAALKERVDACIANDQTTEKSGNWSERVSKDSSPSSQQSLS